MAKERIASSKRQMIASSEMGGKSKPDKRRIAAGTKRKWNETSTAIGKNSERMAISTEIGKKSKLKKLDIAIGEKSTQKELHIAIGEKSKQEKISKAIGEIVTAIGEKSKQDKLEFTTSKKRKWDEISTAIGEKTRQEQISTVIGKKCKLEKFDNAVGEEFKNEEGEIAVCEHVLPKSDSKLEEINARLDKLESSIKKLNIFETINNIRMSSMSKMPQYITIEEQKKNDSRSIYVGNISYMTTTEEVALHFVDCGVISRITIPRNRKSNARIRYAFVEFTKAQFANKALDLHKSTLGGRSIRVMKKRTPYSKFANRGRFGQRN